MLAEWARGTDGNLFPLCRSTACKLTFEESTNKHHLDGSCWIPRASITVQNINIKYHIIFLFGKFFEFILASAKETYFSILVEKILHFWPEPRNSACFRQIQITQRVVKISC